MPGGEGTHDEADDARQHGQQDEVDGHEGVDVLGLLEDLRVDPGPGHGAGVEAEQRHVDQAQQEGLVVAQPDARRQPRAVVVHLQHAPPARRAVVGAVGLPGLALLAEPQVAVRLDGEGGGVGRLDVGGQRRIAGVVGRAARAREDGRGVAPVEHRI